MEGHTLLQTSGADALSEKGIAVRQAWDASIGQALRRGMMPVIDATDGRANEDSWRWFARRYGAVADAWIVRREQDARRIRHAVTDARVYTVDSIDPTDLAAATGNRFVARYVEYSGGRIDRYLGGLRAAALRQGAPPPPRGVRLLMPPSLGDVLMQRRNGFMAAETMIQWWMAGGDALVMESDEVGGDFFPDIFGSPSPAWDSVALLFGLGEGAARRLPCTVTPDEHMALADSYWAAALNGPQLATAVLFASSQDRGRSAALLLPVPWHGPTEGLIEGVDFPGWRNGDPLRIEPERIRAEAGNERGLGHVRVPILMNGLRRVRLWPAGRPPLDRTTRLRALRPQIDGPETLSNVFRLHAAPPPSHGVRYVRLRLFGQGAGALGGEHAAETRTATLGTLPARGIGPQFEEGRVADVRNVAPFEGKSLFVTLRPVKPAHGFRINWDGRRIADASALIFYARVRWAEPSDDSSGRRPPSTVPLWFGSLSRRQRVSLTPDRWHLIVAPFDGFLSSDDNRDTFHLWPDDSQRHVVECELNGFAAVNAKAEDGRKIARSRAAVQWNEDGTQLRVLIEGTAAAPAAWQGRFDRPLRIKTGRVEQPEGFGGVNLTHRNAAQLVEIYIAAMPAAADGVSLATAQELFPLARPQDQPDLSRVIIAFEAER